MNILDKMNLTMRIRTYSELRHLTTFEERFDYLVLSGAVGKETFGFDRYINQGFYGSREWANIRHYIISRDNGCDLGIPGYEVHADILVHHMNPITVDEIKHGDEKIIDPEYLITTTKRTHNAIHYGNRAFSPKVMLQRTPNDTKLW